MVETRKLEGGMVANKMLEVGRGQKRTVKLGKERFECWSLSWKQSTVLYLVGVNLNLVPILRSDLVLGCQCWY